MMCSSLVLSIQEEYSFSPSPLAVTRATGALQPLVALMPRLHLLPPFEVNQALGFNLLGSNLLRQTWTLLVVVVVSTETVPKNKTRARFRGNCSTQLVA